MLQKEEKAIPLTYALCFIWLFHAADCRHAIGQNIQICRFAPNRPLLSRVQTLSVNAT
jgi:hypothetical protein